MQVKNITSIGLGRKKTRWTLALKVLVSAGCLFFIYYQFSEKSIRFDQIQMPDGLLGLLVLQVMLMTINWYLEARRWELSIQTFEPFTPKMALQDVLSGLAMNWVVPFTGGDFIARLAYKKDKFKTTSAMLFNRGIMLSLTLLVGLFSISNYLNLTYELGYLPALALVTLTLVIAFSRKVGRFLDYFYELRATMAARIVVISIVRYGVFFIQFVILLQAFLPDLSTETIMAGVGSIFFMRTVVPSMAGGLGLREASATFYFQSYTPDISHVLVPVFGIWVINTVLPSLVGVLLIWKLRFKIAQ